jgi:hypothetical protein
MQAGNDIELYEMKWNDKNNLHTNFIDLMRIMSTES